AVVSGGIPGATADLFKWVRPRSKSAPPPMLEYHLGSHAVGISTIGFLSFDDIASGPAKAVAINPPPQSRPAINKTQLNCLVKVVIGIGTGIVEGYPAGRQQ